MKLFSRLSRLGKSTVDHAVGITSGAVPVQRLDSNTSAFRFVVWFGIIVLLGSGWLTWSSIRAATKPMPATSTSNVNAGEEFASLRTKDVDQDTLSDYDELFSYKTSPYLRDSDGDTVSDSDELRAGTDPNCPKGKSCDGLAPTTPASDVSPEFLREALKSAGVPQNVIDQTTDTQLLQMYQEVVRAGGSANVNASVIQPTVENLKNLTAEEIRKLLTENGVDAGTLNSVDDATLRQLFQQALEDGS